MKEAKKILKKKKGTGNRSCGLKLILRFNRRRRRHRRPLGKPNVDFIDIFLSILRSRVGFLNRLVLYSLLVILLSSSIQSRTSITSNNLGYPNRDMFFVKISARIYIYN